ncbi:MAG: ABC transporter substrate-binding protein [Stellaceae bacterium]
MKRPFQLVLSASALMLAASASSPGAVAAEPIKVGILGTTSGPYANWGKSFEQSINYFLEQYNGKDGNPKVEIIFRDAGGDNPPRARQLAQELVVRDKVAILGGLEFTTTVLAMADIINEAKIPFVIFNSATSFVTSKSPYYVRAGFTQWQSLYPLSEYALSQHRKTCEMFIADYAPGQDAIDAFTYGFTKGGGKMLDPIRVPMGTVDFSSYFQHVQENKPDCLVGFMPGGPMSISTVKDFHNRGFAKEGMELMGTVGAEFDLPALGDAAIGTLNISDYGPDLDNPENKAFVKGMVAKYGNQMVNGEPSFIHVEAYDGMTMLFHMLKASGGVRDADKMMAAIKGYSWKSPRGPVEVDPDTRELIQNFYIRRVEKVNGKLVERVLKTIPAVKDPWYEFHIAEQKKK